MAGLQEQYRAVRRAGEDFADADPDEQDARLAARQVAPCCTPRLRGLYADPVYGGNRDGVGWASHRVHPATMQPRGWTWSSDRAMAEE